jgi:hypothetical protein
MKVKLPKSYLSLPKSEKDKINEAMTEEVMKQIIHEEAELQKIWLQFACIILNKYFGFGRKRLLIFLGNWREMYRINTKLDGRAKQAEFLTAEMTRIFGKDGYPAAYVDKLEEL